MVSRASPPETKEEIERARGCNYYCGDCHALTVATASGSPQWSQLQFGAEAPKAGTCARRPLQRGRSCSAALASDVWFRAKSEAVWR